MRIILGVVGGGILGYGYYKYIGCSTGVCPITSNPYTSVFYGMLMGGLMTA